VKLEKWQGLGNDYLVVEETALPGELTRAAVGLLCDRHVGVGADGILVRCAPTGAVPGAVARMRVFNPDGSEPEMCGNGVRMFARYLMGSGAVRAPEFVVETLAGPIQPRVQEDGTIRVDMGRARFRGNNIALHMAVAANSGSEGRAEGGVETAADGDVVNACLEAGGSKYRFTFVDVGNPHCVVQVDDPASFDVAGVGALIERHPLFPNRANVQFVHVETDRSVRMRVWERGVGETRASGTGATAVGAACVRLGLTASPVRVHLPGGDLMIDVDTGDARESSDGLRVFMTGPAEQVFSAELSDDLLERLGWLAQASKQKQAGVSESP
jgi:diaminopimelate epimerase